MRLLRSYLNNTTFLFEPRTTDRNVSSGEHKIAKPSKCSGFFLNAESTIYDVREFKLPQRKR